MQAAVRLQNEAKNMRSSRSFGFYARPYRGDVFIWLCQIPHRGHFLQLLLHFGPQYPLVCPAVRFLKRVYHPNIYCDGQVCLDILGHRWSPALSIKDILNGLVQLLDYPNADSPANGSAADAMQRNRKKYESNVLSSYRKDYPDYVFMDESVV